MKYLSETQVRILKFCTLLASAIPVLLVITDIYDNFNRNSAIGVIGDGFLLVGALYLFGITGSLLYSGSMATNFIDFLFYPRHYLKAPPVITSRQQGLIAAKKFQLAEKELFELRDNNPASPEVALLIADLHAEAFSSKDAAIADILYYQRHRRLRYHQLNLQLTMRCVDFYSTLNRWGEAAEMLKRELTVPFVYTKRERDVLHRRLSALLQQLN